MFSLLDFKRMFDDVFLGKALLIAFTCIISTKDGIVVFVQFILFFVVYV